MPTKKENMKTGQAHCNLKNNSSVTMSLPTIEEHPCETESAGTETKFCVSNNRPKYQEKLEQHFPDILSKACIEEQSGDIWNVSETKIQLIIVFLI